MEQTGVARLWTLVAVLATATRCTATPPAGPGGQHGGSYRKQHAYKDNEFLDKFDFLDATSPRDGHVSYLDRHSAQKAGLAVVQDGNIFLGVDASGVTGGARRKSVRLSSKAVYNSGLFVLSLDHMPTGCGTWPSFELKGNDAPWPQHGGITIIEGVHSMTQVKPSLHTTAGCDQSSSKSGADFTGVWARGSTKPEANDCFNNAPGQWKRQGCEQIGPSDSMGKPFNDDGGGTFVTEWQPTRSHIRSWFFRSTELPSDLANGNPDPDSWGKPFSSYRLSEKTCSSRHFVNMSIEFDLNLCGSYGDALFQASCPLEASSSGSCNNYVSNNPKVMQQAYWSIRSLDVYQWSSMQRKQTTTAGVVSVLRDPTTDHPASAAVTTTMPSTQTLSTTRSSTPPPVTIPGAAVRMVSAAKAAPWQALRARGYISALATQDTAQEKKAGSFMSGVLHLIEPAEHTNDASHVGTDVIEETVTDGGILNAGSIGQSVQATAGTIERTVAGGPPPLHVTGRISPSASLVFCSAAIALGILAFWAKMGSLASAFERHERHTAQLISTSPEESSSVHQQDDASSRLSVPDTNVSSPGSANSDHNGGDTAMLQRDPCDSDSHAGSGLHPSEHRPLGGSSGDVQPPLLDFLEADDGNANDGARLSF